MAGARRSTATCLLKRSGEFSYAFFCHLPLVVVRAMTWATSGLLFAAHIQTKVFYAVIGLVSVHVVNAFFGRKWSTEMGSHDEPVFHNRLPAALHLPKHRKQAVWNRIDIYKNVAGPANPIGGAVFPNVPSVCSAAHGGYGARPAVPMKIISLCFPADIRDRAWPGCIATRASNVDDKNFSPFSFHYPHFFPYSRMWWQWRCVGFLWH